MLAEACAPDSPAVVETVPSAWDVSPASSTMFVLQPVPAPPMPLQPWKGIAVSELIIFAELPSPRFEITLAQVARQEGEYLSWMLPTTVEPFTMFTE